MLVAGSLGPAKYGFFVLAMSVFEALLVAFYGISAACTKYVAETGLLSVVKKTAVIEIVTGFILAVAVFIGADTIAGWLGHPIAGYLRIIAAILLSKISPS